jgi:hypothetical protein
MLTHGQHCDIYKLYTKGPHGRGKVAIAATEAVDDTLTCARLRWSKKHAGDPPAISRTR